MMKLKFLSLLMLLTLAGLAGCTTTSHSENAAHPDRTHPQASVQPNLVSLFFVKQDQQTNQWRGEVYPIALYLQGHYIDASQDVTPEVRDDFDEERLIQNKQSKSFLSAIQTFTVMNGADTAGTFQVKNLSIGQMACSSMLVGQGNFEQDISLPTLFEALPESHSGGVNGIVNNREVKESWRWTIALSQYHPLAASSPQVDEAKLRQDLLTAAEPLIAQSSEVQQIEGDLVVEQLTAVDLDRNGKPEVFGTLRKGRDPASIPPQQGGLPREPIVYLNLWLSDADTPTVLADEMTRYEYPVSRSPYTLVDTLDIDGDGTQEVIVQNNGYEATSFGIYELDGKTLKQVFNGAGYGC